MSEKILLKLNGLNLSGIHWKISDAKAALCIIHGLGEHCKRYDPLAEKLNSALIAVLSIDLPGHGKTKGKRGHSNQEELMNSIQKLSEFAGSSYPGKPLLIYGHSMGGNLAMIYLLKMDHHFKAAVISSPWIELSTKPSIFKLAIAKMAHKFYPSYKDRTELNAEFLSRVKEEVEKYKEDPLVHDYITPELFFTIVKNGRWLLHESPRLTTPTLLMHGTADKLTSAKATSKFAVRNPGMVELKLWDGGYHELHNDKIREEVINFVTTWLLGHL